MANERSASGANRRAYVRLPLRLAARLEGESWPERTGQIRDFCPGGIFLACPIHDTDPAIGDLDPADGRAKAVVRFQTDPRAGTRVHEVSVRVVRAFEAGVGLAFVDADVAALDALQQLAQRQVEATAAQTGGNPSIAGTKREEIVRECSLLCVSRLDDVLEGFFRRAEKKLLLATREATSSFEQQQFSEALNAVDAVEGRSASLRECFSELIARHFAELGQPLAAVEKPQDSAQSAGLSLIEKDEFEEFLVVSELSTKLEFSHDVILLSINWRLDNVASSRILNENNPVGPVAVCHAFGAALQTLQQAERPNRLLHDAFAEEVGESLGDLYQAVDQFLDDHGVHPKSPYAKQPTPESVVRSRRGRRLESGQTPVVAGEVQALVTPGSSVPTPRAGGARGWGGISASDASLGDAGVRVDSTPPRAVALSDLEVGNRQRSGANSSAGAIGIPAGAGPMSADRLAPLITHSRRSAPHEIGAAAAAGATQALMSIQRAVAALPDNAAASAGGEFFAELSSGELLDAIALMPSQSLDSASLDGNDVATMSGASFKDRVLAVLDGSSGSAGKRIGSVALDSMELVGFLFEAFAEDPHLDETLKPLVLRLETVVQRTALADGTVLVVRDHPVRLLLNALDCVDGAPEPESGRFRLEGQIAPIVERVVNESEQDPAAYSLAHDFLSTLLDGQSAAYEAHVAHVVEMSESQQAFLKQRRATPEAEGTGEVSGSVASQEWAVWLNRAMRLQVGDEVEFGAQGGRNQRLNLVWIGEKHNPLVFVNRRGEKEASLSLPELAMNLRRGLAVVRDRPKLPLFDRAMFNVLQRVHGRIERSATHDQLTGVSNRRSFEAEMTGALKQSVQDRDREHALCVVRLEGLNDVEREGGARARASVIRQAMAALERTVGPDVAVGVVDEERFGLLLRDVISEHLNATLRRFQRAVEGETFDWDGAHYSVRVCMGAALIGHSTSGKDEAIAGACEACEAAGDEADRLYIAEREGGTAPAGGMMDWVTLINRTLGQDLVQLRCQLVRPLGDGGKPYYEVLLGLKDDEDHAVAAADFIAALEYYEQMAALDRWVIRNALKWMASNRKPVQEVAGFTIKLTPHSLKDDNLMEYVLEQLTATAVPPGKICFEITQVDAQANLGQTDRLVRTLREFGCRFSLSKFGSGAPNQEELQKLPVDFVKVDGRFVRGIAESPDDLAMVQSVTHLAHALGMRIVAEFVEQPEIVETLEACGVDLVQGMAIEEPRYLTDLGPPPADSLKEEPRAANASGVQAETAGSTGWEEDLSAFLELDADSLATNIGSAVSTVAGAEFAGQSGLDPSADTDIQGPGT